MTDIIGYGRDVLRAEIAGLKAVQDSLGAEFEAAVDLILSIDSHLIVVGVGKSGIIGQKIASSFASTGTPSFFLHPTEASHGDLGMIVPGCALLIISNSGESRELGDVLKYAKRLLVPVIAMTGKPNSRLGSSGQIVLTLPGSQEACPNGIAPTTSTTNSLAIGDALVVAAMRKRGFTLEEFGLRHPGGKIGLQLQTIEEWLATHKENVPQMPVNAGMDVALSAITKGGRGCAAVIDEAGRMLGIITDGDLRRAMDADFFNKQAHQIMTASPIALETSMKISDVIAIFTKRRISNAFILEEGRPIGVIDMKGLLEEGYL